MDDQFNVKSYGAVGDGKTNDTAAIQKAIDAASKVQATVFVPAGVYICGKLKMHPGTGMLGTPAWDYRTSRGSILQLDDSKPDCLLDITGAYGVTIQGMCLKGLGPEDPTLTHGIMVNNEHYKQEDTPCIDGCKVEKFSGDGIRLERIWCFSVRHSHSKSNGGCGLRMRGWDGFILDNWFSGNHGVGYGAFEENASITMTGNRIEWNRQGGFVAMGGAQYNLTGNYIDRSGRSAIAIIPRQLETGPKTSHHFACTGNVIYRSGKPDWPVENKYQNAHVRIEGSESIVFTGNSMFAGKDDGGRGSYSPDYGMILKDLENCIIKDNVMGGSALKELIVDQGGHKSGVIIKDNVGSLKVIDE